MHQIIRIIVYSENKEEAKERAEHLLDENLVGENKPFDYGTFFDNKDTTMSGQARWGKKSPISLANSKEGKELINDGMEFTKEEFLNNLKEVRKLINKYQDEELFEEKLINIKSKVIKELGKEKEDNLSLFRYYCNEMGSYKGSEIYLYDNEGEGIRTEEHLKNVLNKWKCFYEDKGEKNPYKELNIYVVPCDCHH